MAWRRKKEEDECTVQQLPTSHWSRTHGLSFAISDAQRATHHRAATVRSICPAMPKIIDKRRDVWQLPHCLINGRWRRCAKTRAEIIISTGPGSYCRVQPPRTMRLVFATWPGLIALFRRSSGSPWSWHACWVTTTCTRICNPS